MSSVTPSVMLFHYSRLCCRQSTMESGDLLLGFCSSFPPSSSTAFSERKMYATIYLIELHFTAGTILLSNVFCTGHLYDSKSWNWVGWRHGYLSKICSCTSDAVRHLDHPILRIRPTGYVKVVGTE